MDAPVIPSISRSKSRASSPGLLVAIAAAAFLLAACVGGASPSSGSASAPPESPVAGSIATFAPSRSTATPVPAPVWPLHLTDDEGTEIAIPAEPQRIVSLTPATTEILFAVGAGGRVVATTDFDDYPPEAVPLVDVASYTAVDVEKIVGLEADLVVAGGNNFNDPGALARLRSLGIPVVVVYAPDVDTVLADIELVAAAAGQPGDGADLVTRMRSELEAIAEATSALPAPRVFYEIDATNAIFGPADDSFLAEMIRLAGGEPITTGDPFAYEIPLEILIEADPEVIVLGDAAYGVTPEAVAARPGWGGMTAVRERAIRPVNDVVVTRPGPRLAEGLRALALAIHPDAALPPAPGGSAP